MWASSAMTTAQASTSRSISPTIAPEIARSTSSPISVTASRQVRSSSSKTLRCGWEMMSLIRTSR